ncbi:MULTISPECIES: response regulator transcription factor [unclassified Pseudofrankia]|uniref:response regulator transcription factor n=1 Tax=unclassified Pseudofrankia TaxID=2994372 RepID=UPI000AEA0E24|nr:MULTISPECIES: response regulator transcription factor [unclassified Pseudofrankia]MDT3442028.1 response regulator transcription factor [Pseudofrankia sp. BMG5.37]
MWSPVTVAAVDDHPIVLQGLSMALRQLPGIELIATARSTEELMSGDGRHADVVLLDLSLGDGSNPPDTIRQLIERGMGVAVYSATADPATVRLAIRAGAAAFVAKTDQLEDLAKAVHATADGSGWISPPLAFLLLTDDAPDRPRLSAQERQALQLYAAGMSMKKVASRMGIAVETAKQYIDRVRRKYRETGREATTKIDLLHRAVEDGYLDPPGPTGLGPPA